MLNTAALFKPTSSRAQSIVAREKTTINVEEGDKVAFVNKIINDFKKKLIIEAYTTCSL